MMMLNKAAEAQIPPKTPVMASLVFVLIPVTLVFTINYERSYIQPMKVACAIYEMMRPTSNMPKKTEIPRQKP
jgi:hypothetical protein